jgi:hypothetical protein
MAMAFFKIKDLMINVLPGVEKVEADGKCMLLASLCLQQNSVEPCPKNTLACVLLDSGLCLAPSNNPCQNDTKPECMLLDSGLCLTPTDNPCPQDTVCLTPSDCPACTDVLSTDICDEDTGVCPQLTGCENFTTFPETEAGLRELKLLKEELRKHLVWAEMQEAKLEKSLEPKNVQEIEKLENQLQEALTDLQERKRRLKDESETS